MKRFTSVVAFQAFLRGDLPGRIARGKAAGIAAGAELVRAEMTGEIGTYQKGDAPFPDWETLRPGTLHGFGPLPGKIANGHAPPDNPLLAIGAMRESIGVKVEGDYASIGTDDPVAVYQEMGTEKRGVPFVTGDTAEPGIEARSFIGRAGFRTSPDVAMAISQAIIAEIVK